MSAFQQKAADLHKNVSPEGSAYGVLSFFGMLQAIKVTKNNEN